MKNYSYNSNFKGFKKNISLTDRDKKQLLDARKEIRSHIRKTFQDEDLQLPDEGTAFLSRFVGSASHLLTPRFMTQGSFAYGTINKPAQPPKQQMDLDDGIYFPLAYPNDISGVDFQTAAKILRWVVYECVSNLAQRKRWQYELKSKCIRVTISQDAHIDLPVYSVPHEEMGTIREAAMVKGSTIPAGMLVKAAENVLLATDDGWIKSDPRVIHEWVKGSKERLGNRFIEHCRYVKAWRDHWWEETDFASIMIMAGVEKAMCSPEYKKYKEEDNIALELGFIVRKISMDLYEGGEGIRDPDGGHRLDEGLENREEIANFLERLANHLNRATKEGDVQLLIYEFGERFPSSKGEERNVASAIVSGAAFSPTISSHVIRPYGSLTR